MFEKSSHIELGGHKKYTSNSFINNPAKPSYPANFTQNANLNKAVSKQIILSTHQIPGKKSPSKHHLQSNQTSRKGSILTNQNSYIEMIDSSMQTPSIHNKVYKLKSPFHETGNISPQRQLIRVNFVSTSPATQKNSLSKRQTRVTPNKMITCGQTKEDILERKLKVLQGRIGELHKQKHQLVGRLNQENRKIYHQNTSLKLKITDLMTKIDKNTHHPDIRIQESANQQIISKYQAKIKQLSQKNDSFSQQYQQVTNMLKQSNLDIKKLQNQNKRMGKMLQQKQKDYGCLHSQYLQICQQKQSLKQMKQKYEQDLQQIQQSITQNSKYNSMILQQYQAKLQQYKQAYDKNQQIIEQLSQQLHQQYSSHNAYPSSDQIILRESQGGEGEILAQCKNLQNNFLKTLDEKDEIIANLQNKNEQIKCQLVNKDQLLDQLSSINEQQAKRLEDVGLLLQNYTEKIKELQNKYQQLCRNIEAQRQKNNSKIEKCKKCDQLTKTIFRLNSHLNKKS